MSRTQKKVYEAVWPWRSRTAGGDSGAAETPRPRRVLCEAAVTTAVALVLWLVFHKTVMAVIVFSLAVLVFVGGLWMHSLYRVFRKAGLRLARGVGIGLSWVLLLPFFYLCFPFGRLLFALGRRDLMHREFLPEDQTYWSVHRPLPEADRYRRQY
jgi:hypothetical protein